MNPQDSAEPTSALHRFAVILPLLFLLFFAPSPAHAHKVTVFAWVENDVIHTESSFSGGKKVHEGVVEVLNLANGKRLLTGQPDDEGLFSFPVPKGATTGLRIVVKAGAGHQAEWIVTADEYLVNTGDAPGMGASAQLSQADSLALTSADEQTLERVIRRVLGKELDPIKRDIAAMKDPGVSAKDVFSGLGYILGLLGLIILLKRPTARDVYLKTLKAPQDSEE